MTWELGGGGYALLVTRAIERDRREQALRRRATWGSLPRAERRPDRRPETVDARETRTPRPRWARR